MEAAVSSSAIGLTCEIPKVGGVSALPGRSVTRENLRQIRQIRQAVSAGWVRMYFEVFSHVAAH